MTETVENDHNDKLALSFIRNLIKVDSRFKGMREEQALHLIKIEGHFNAVVAYVAQTNHEQKELASTSVEVAEIIDSLFRKK